MSIKRLFRLLIAASILALTFAFTPITANAEGWWGDDNGKWYYDRGDGSRLTNAWHYDGAWYYFGSDTYMVTGLQTIGEHTYYFCESDHGNWTIGRMMTGWQYINGDYMYFDSNGYYHAECKGDENTIKGIDVSQYQGNMDWTKVKNQGISFAFIRVGHGTHELDPTFVKNIDNANAVGIKVGVYFYSTAQSVEESRSDALWVIDQLKGHTVSYPVAIDLESNSQVDLGWETITAMAKAFCDEIKAAGYTPMIYCNENWAKKYIDWTQLDGIYKWIARYNGTYNTDYTRDIWQAGSTTLLDGITVNSVDIDFAFTDFSTIVTPRTERIPVAENTDTGNTDNTTKTGQWMNSSGRWWYKWSDGSYAKSEWLELGGIKYYFDASGYLHSGWLGLGEDWYYISSNGAYKSRWITSGGTWYYLNDDCKMAKGEWRDGYYLSSNGAWSYKGIGSWYQNKTGWWYEDSKGWYPVSQWAKINGKWYYFDANGYMMADTTVDGCKLGSDGAWIPETTPTTQQ